MLWAIFAAIGASANAAFFICNKRFLEKFDPYHLAAANFIGTSFFLFMMSLYKGIPHIGPHFFWAIGCTMAINVIASILLFKALQSSDISLAVPMLSFTPAFLIVILALNNKFLSLTGILGISIIVIGSYVLNTSEEHSRLRDPVLALVNNRGAMIMVCVSLLYAIAIEFDTIMVRNSNSTFGSSISFCGLGIAFTLISLIRWRYSLKQESEKTHSGCCHILSTLLPLIIPSLVIGVISAIEESAVNEAYLLQNMAYVNAIKRMSIIPVVLYGTVIIKEQEFIYRLCGVILMVIGAVILIVVAPEFTQ